MTGRNCKCATPHSWGNLLIWRNSSRDLLQGPSSAEACSYISTKERVFSVAAPQLWNVLSKEAHFMLTLETFRARWSPSSLAQAFWMVVVVASMCLIFGTVSFLFFFLFSSRDVCFILHFVILLYWFQIAFTCCVNWFYTHFYTLMWNLSMKGS